MSAMKKTLAELDKLEHEVGKWSGEVPLKREVVDWLLALARRALEQPAPTGEVTREHREAVDHAIGDTSGDHAHSNVSEPVQQGKSGPDAPTLREAIMGKAFFRAYLDGRECPPESDWGCMYASQRNAWIARAKHYEQHGPYRRRSVTIELTPEQEALLRPRVVGEIAGKEVTEEVLTCWLENDDTGKGGDK